MKFKVSTSAKAIADTTSSYIASSGVYDVIINFASVAVSSGGATSVNFNVDYGGVAAVLYGPYIADKQDNPISIGMTLINKLGVIAGMTDGDELEVSTEEHSVGKDNKVQSFDVIQQFSDLPVKIRVQEEYGINPTTNSIRKSLVIKSFFRQDGASADEIVNDTPIGKRLATELERYATNITYRDNVTPEDVAEWVAAQQASRASPSAQPVASAPKKMMFKRS